MTFKFTAAQTKAQSIVAGPATHALLVGGSRSGKTALHTRNICMRAIKAPASRHAIARFRGNAVRASVMLDTFPKVMRLAFPNVAYELNKQEGLVRFQNQSELWFVGLDDKERVEKILGMEFVTWLLNECSEIPLSSRDVALTRLAQQVEQTVDGVTSIMRPRMWYDCNPPSKAHWAYKEFILKVSAETGLPLPNPDDYAWFKMNPADNKENIAESYLTTLQGMSARHRRRFLDGEWADATEGALFNDTDIDKWRVVDAPVPDMVRIVIAVDPSGSGDTNNADNDAIGIVGAGLGTDGNAYILGDYTVKAGPATWGRVVTDAFDRLGANIVVGEGNYGGAMVNYVVQQARPRTPFKLVTATRGKHVRAEPFSALYETGKVRHVGFMRELEDELCGFTVNGYVGENSPNRADAAIWALAELFPAIIKPRDEKPVSVQVPSVKAAWNR